MWSLAISLEKAGADALVVNEDYGYQSVEYKATKETRVIFDGIVECLRLLSEEYPEEVKVFYHDGLENA